MVPLRRILPLAGLLLSLLCSPTGLTGQDAEAAEQPPEQTQRELGYWDALILGVVEGITEYLPVSSTGHLLLTNAVLGLDEDTPLINPDGQPLQDPSGLPYTLKQAADAYAVIIQGGAILAVVVLYWSRLWSIVLGFLGRDPEGRRLGLNLIVAFLPAAVLGLLLDDLIESFLFGPLPIAIALAGGGVLMLGVERWRGRSQRDPEAGPDLPALSYRQCLIIGLLQCVAMWPGTSRSMMTIVGGYVAGLSPKRAAEFSFLLGLITLTAAASYRVVTDGRQMMAALEPGPVLFGGLIAFIASALAVKWLVSYLTRHGLSLFAWYRFVLAALVLVFLVEW